MYTAQARASTDVASDVVPYTFERDFSGIARPGMNRYLRRLGYDPDAPADGLDDCWRAGLDYLRELRSVLTRSERQYYDYGRALDLEVYGFAGWTRESVAAYVEARLSDMIDAPESPPVDLYKAVYLGTELARERGLDVGPEAVAYAADRLKSKIERDVAFEGSTEVLDGFLSYDFLKKMQPLRLERAERAGKAPDDTKVVYIDVYKRQRERAAEEAERQAKRDQWTPKAQIAPRLPVITGKDLLARTDIADPWFLVEGMIQGKKVNLVSGQDGAGKSFLMLQLAIAVATGGYWLGSKMEKGPVIFYTAEEELADLRVRIMAIVASLGYTEPPDLSDLHLIPMGGEGTAVLGEPIDGKIQATALWKALVGNIEEIEPVLVIVDPLNETYDGDELKRVQARQFIGLMRPVAAKRNLAIIVTAHPSKTGIEERTGNSGSTGWSALMRGGANLEILWDENDKTIDTGKRLLSPRKVTGGERTAKLDLVKGPGGVLLVDVPGGGASGPINLSAGLAKVEAEKQEFMDVIEAKAKIGVFLSASPKSPKGYGPKVVGEGGKGGKGKDRLTRLRANERIMEALLDEGRIISEQYGAPSDGKWRLTVVSRSIPDVSETENLEGEDEE